MIETVSMPRYYTIPGLKNKESISTFEYEQRKAAKIIDVVCRYFGLEYEELKKRSRKREIVYARSICIYLIRSNTTLALRIIGELFYKCDHSTVIHAKDSVQDQLNFSFDNPYKTDIKEISKLLNI